MAQLKLTTQALSVVDKLYVETIYKTIYLITSKSRKDKTRMFVSVSSILALGLVHIVCKRLSTNVDST